MNTTNRIGLASSASGPQSWQAVDATTMADLPGVFTTATREEVDSAMEKAVVAFAVSRNLPASARASFLRGIAEGIESLGDTLVQRIVQETALSEARVRNERARTTGQLRMFADLIEKGAWLEIAVDHANSERNPPKPDLRCMMHPIGPVVVFTASNFPLAYSTAGGDTASALAVGCPVIVKAHEAHPGTNALVADAILTAAQNTGMPDGIFSTLYAKAYTLGEQLVEHPATAGVGFTGSRSGGRALYDLAVRRESPIPVFAEMSSINPVFLLPGAVRERAAAIAGQIAAAVNLGAGQFCTCPGLIIAIDDVQTRQLINAMQTEFAEYPSLTMLHTGIQRNYSEGKSRFFSNPDVHVEYSQPDFAGDMHRAGPAIASVPGRAFLRDGKLQDEVFGPFTMLVLCADMNEMYAVAKTLHGQLTATIHCDAEDTIIARTLTDLLRERAGRIVFNGVPTGVEVSPAMVHGGPYPATTDSRFTAVGTAAIRRWLRPVTYQNCPPEILPEVLRDRT
jgi:2,5-dioxopentanoate dehydrogenase